VDGGHYLWWAESLSQLDRKDHQQKNEGNQSASWGRQVSAAEIADPAVVRLLIAGENPEGGVFPAGLLSVGILLPVDGVDFSRSSSPARSSKKNTRWFSGNQSTGDGSSSSVCSGFQGRKDLGLTIPHSLA